MAPISNASKLAEFGSGIGTAGAVLQVDNTNKRIGIGTTNPQSVFQVGTGVSVYGDVGIVSCTEVRADTLRGDGTNITGVVGVGTLNVRTETVTTSGVSTFAGVTKVTNTTDTTSTTTGALIISGGVGIAKSLHVGQNITIGGTLTYEDVTNVDSIGLITARSGVNVTGGQIQVGAAFSVGNAGVATAAGFVGGTISGTTGTFTGDVDIADKIIHTGDTNTALRFPSADTVTVETAGTERLRIADDGELTSTATQADVATFTSNQSASVIYVKDTDGDGILISGSSAYGHRIYTNTTEDLLLGTNSAQNLRITSTGVGIGTLTSIGPTSLLVARNETSGYIASFRGVHASNSAQIIIDSPTDNNTRPSSIDLANGGVVKWSLGQGYASASSGAFHVATSKLQSNDDGAKVTVSTAGLVGIGTINPSSLLTLNNDSSTYMTLKRANTNHFQVGTDNAGHYIVGREDKPIIFANSASSAYTERVRITSGGLVGINTDTPGTNHNLEILGNASAYAVLNVKSQSLGHGSSLELGAVDDDNYGVITQFASGAGESGRMRFIAGTTETMNLVGGRVLIGETSADTDLGGALQVVGDTYGESGILQARTSANQYGPSLDFLKSRNATWGSHTIVQDGDQLGTIQFRGDDGVNYSGGAAAIKGEVDGTPGANDLPGRLVFLTSADGTDSASERLRITSLATFDFSNGALIEKVNITAGKLSDNTNIDLGDGMVHYFTTQETTTCTPNIRINSSTELNDVMGLGDVITVTLVTTAAAGGYSANILIDSQTITEEWVGGSAPDAGGDDGLDIYVYTIICIHASNVGDSGFKVIANKVNATN